MNFLMHIYLSKEQKEEMIGNFLGDFIKGNLADIPIKNRYIKLGILLHRKIDSYSEKNPVFKKSRERFPEDIYRFSGIVVDVIYDHFLAKNFEDLENKKLDLFLDEFYTALNTTQISQFLSCEKYNLVKKIADENWMYRYKNKDFVEKCIKRLSKRLRKSNTLEKSIYYINKHYTQLEKDFFEFLPQVQEFVIQTKKNLL